MPGLILSAPASGSGKTTLTLGVIRALTRAGIAVTSGKSGPDYIDPRFHEAASGTHCVNLDAWAMTPARLRSLAATDDPLLIVEGAMGLFDGAPPDNKGSTADLAKTLGLPVIMVIDAGKMAGSIAPLAAGFARHDPDVHVAAILLNNVGSARHETMLRRALGPLGIPVLGAIPRMGQLATPSRHLGLVQAMERTDLEQFLDTVAGIVEAHIDIAALAALAYGTLAASDTSRLRPPGQRIAVAHDTAFGFSYPHMMADWRHHGAEITVFSPLADDPVPGADFVFLPGGYPELHAGVLAQNETFLNSLKNAAEGTDIYGECGGYMMLGETLIDAQGHCHKMAGLLPVQTSFATRKLHLGYRTLTARHGPMAGTWRGHEFHYSTTQSAEGTPLFKASDAEGTALPDMGLVAGRVSGSYAHIIDRAD
ncbi:cobyrinate a,c-diamide synthase [Algirhabdus cladophorae]|uniref:cobyrinate a,c-diamide synthase n=1 Tax=Algirhabdus cladophorae TaxID=3377108 RepID=UPI003B8452EA